MAWIHCLWREHHAGVFEVSVGKRKYNHACNVGRIAFDQNLKKNTFEDLRFCNLKCQFNYWKRPVGRCQVAKHEEGDKAYPDNDGDKEDHLGPETGSPRPLDDA